MRFKARRFDVIAVTVSTTDNMQTAYRNGVIFTVTGVITSNPAIVNIYIIYLIVSVH
jgi:hypothetical protein